MLTTTACHLLLSLLHLSSFSSPPSLPSSFPQLCRSLSYCFSSTRPLLSRVLIALSRLPPSHFQFVSLHTSTDSSLFRNLLLSVQPTSADDIAQRVSSALQHLLSLRPAESGQPTPPRLILAVMEVASSWVEVQSPTEWGRVRRQLRVEHLHSLIYVWASARGDDLRALRPLLRFMLAAYITSISPREGEQEDADTRGQAPPSDVATAHLCAPTDPVHVRCDHLLTLFRVVVSAPHPLPSSILRFVTAHLLRHPAMSSRVATLFSQDLLESPSPAVSANSAALLQHVYSQSGHHHELLPPLLAAYPRTTFDLTPLFTALPFSFTLPHLVSHLLSEPDPVTSTRARIPPPSLFPLIEAVLTSANDQCEALLALIDAINNFSSKPSTTLWTPGSVEVRGASQSSLSAAHRSYLLHFVDVALSLPIFTSSELCGAAIKRLLSHLLSYPSSSLHLSIVTHLQSYLESNVSARTVLLHYCLDVISDEDSIEQLQRSRMDEASREQVLSSLLFLHLFPILVPPLPLFPSVDQPISRDVRMPAAAPVSVDEKAID